jgi:hypothetical protein
MKRTLTASEKRLVIICVSVVTSILVFFRVAESSEPTEVGSEQNREPAGRVLPLQ